jgi:integrase
VQKHLESVASNVVGGVEPTLMLLEQHALQIPERADVVSFILSGGRTVKMPDVKEAAKVSVTLEQLKENYVETLAIGAVEENSLYTVKMHLRHFIKTLGAQFVMQTLTMNDLQEHVTTRAKAQGIKGRKLSPVTLRKEIASLRACWNWGVHAGLVSGNFPNRGLKFPKLTEKHPFQTWDEIQRRIASGVTPAEEADLWDSLFLRTHEIAELLEFVRANGTQPWIHPLVYMAAHTGARRSEILRCDIHDLDFHGDTILIHEKKRVKGTHTTRRVTMTPSLKNVLNEWLRIHPGGKQLFTQNVMVVRSKTRRVIPTPVTRDECHDHFSRTLEKGKWRVLRGIHSLRHAYISCLAAAGIDQRIIDDLVGHQSEQQRQRYRHLTPNLKKEAVNRVFC